MATEIVPSYSYQIVTAESVEALDVKVQALRSKGWEPTGGVASDGKVWAQAMVEK